MSYCLVCLASGTKEACVQCGRKPSKRVEQLVHLRLKSIYKAFKQSGAALNGPKGKQSSTETARDGLNGADEGNMTRGTVKVTADDERGLNGQKMESSGSTYSWGECMEASNPGPIPHPATVQKYAAMHGKEDEYIMDQTSSAVRDRFSPNCSIEVGAALTAAAAASGAVSASSASSSIELTPDETDQIFASKRNFIKSSCKASSFPDDFLRHARKGNEAGSCQYSGRDDNYNNDLHNISKRKSHIGSEQFASKTQEEADAAAAALLAELDEENLRSEATSKAKKSKKKKKKERQQAAKEKEREEMRSKQLKEEERQKALKADKVKQSNLEKQNANLETEKKLVSRDNLVATSVASKKKKKNKTQVEVEQQINRSQHKAEVAATNQKENEESETVDNAPLSGDESKTERESTEEELAKLVTAGDLDGIEKLLQRLKGVPGKAALRKNAKKAVKRIKQEQTNTLQKSIQNKRLDMHSDMDESDIKTKNIGVPDAKLSSGNSISNPVNGTRYKPSEPLLKLVSSTHNVQTKSAGGQNISRSECVMHMAPSVVGWVIGKGGQRIRDLMEESGARVWIDQDSMGPSDMRIVYVSGTRKAIDTAVRMVKDLVAKAPIGGSTLGVSSATTEVQAIHDASSVSSTVSSLTSTTPVSFNHNVFVQHPAVIFDKGNLPPPVKPSLRATPPVVTNSVSQAHLRENELPNMLPPVDPKRTANVPSRNLELPPGILDPSDKLYGHFDGTSLTHNGHSSEPNAVREITCEPRFVPLLIGRRGWTVKNIQDTSGARVDIDQTVTPRRIIISGKVSQVEKALHLVQEVLSYPHAQLHYRTPGTNVELESTSHASLNQLLGSLPPTHPQTNFTFSQQGISNSGEGNHHVNHLSDHMGVEHQQHTSNLIIGSQGRPTEGHAQVERHQLHPQIPSSSGILNHHQQYHGGMNMYGNSNQLPSQPPLHTEPMLLNPTMSNQLNRRQQNSLPDQTPMLYQANAVPDPRVHVPHLLPQHNYQRSQKQTQVTDNFHFDSVRSTSNNLSSGLGSDHVGHILSNQRAENERTQPLAFSRKLQASSQNSTNGDINEKMFFHSSTDGEIIEKLFGASSQPSQNEVGGSLLQGISAISLESSGVESGSGGFGLGHPNWNWESILTNDDEKLSNKGVGLGGVRLDLSSEKQNHVHVPINQQENSIWGAK